MKHSNAILVEADCAEGHNLRSCLAMVDKIDWQAKFRRARNIISRVPGALRGIPLELANYSPKNRSQPTTVEKRKRKYGILNYGR